ncbi:MAG: MraY family glycosyltransferase [Sedimentisphaerales bacterium]|nr:MraY family glycosyltransferase [Sedimentisphaerales bacterium]
MRTYLLTYLCSAVLTLLIAPLIIYIARTFGLYDAPGARKVHATAIPRIGGIAIFLSTTVLVITILFLDNRIGEIFRNIQPQIIAMLIGSALIFFVGIVDDLRGIRAYQKLFAQIVAAAVVCLAGIRIESIVFTNLFTLHFGWLSFPITIFWIVAITNAMNLIDGLDGLAAGIAAVACAVIAIFAINNGLPLMAVVMLALLGSLTGFLFFNINPARIFMGDCGSMFLGFIIASASIRCAAKSETLVALALPALALGLPIFDMIVSIIRRYVSRWGIMSADRGHLHHRLMDMGLRQRHVVVGMYLITAIAAGFGLFMMVANTGGSIAIFLSVMVLFLLVFRAVGAIQLRQIAVQMKSNLTVARQAREHVDIFRNTLLMFGEADSFKKLWQAISNACEKMKFAKLSLSLTARNGHIHTFIWLAADEQDNHDDVVCVRLHVDEHRVGIPIDIEAKIPANNSLESIGQRMMLLGRLIDEYGVATLSGKTKKRIVSVGKTRQSRKSADQLFASHR